MKISELTEAKFIKRLNRFVAEVSLQGKNLLVYVRNTGRLIELLKPGNRVFLKEKSSGRYPFEIFLAEGKNSLVCVDSTMAPKLYAEFLGVPVKFEPTFGSYRFDLLYSSKVVETKSVNLVEDGVALFPDAPTKRGTKHVYKLMEVSKRGLKPELVFVIQREDAEAFSPNYKVDREFSEAVRLFYQMGFPVRAFLCRVSLSEIMIDREIGVIFLEHG
ncbi:DNA/RNA nuclease SfsA [Thermocrinis sp.]